MSKLKTTPQINLRVAEESDGEFLYRVFESVCAETLGYVEEPMRTKLIQMQFLGQRSSYAGDFPDATDYLICDSGQPVGRMLVDDSPNRVRLVDIALLSECRGQGIGGQAMALLIDLARKKKQNIELSVARQNPKAESFYQRFGFEQIDEDEISIQMKLTLPASIEI